MPGLALASTYLYSSGAYSFLLQLADEEALVKAAKKIGFNYIARTHDSITVEVVSVCVCVLCGEIDVTLTDIDCDASFLHSLASQESTSY